MGDICSTVCSGVCIVAVKEQQRVASVREIRRASLTSLLHAGDIARHKTLARSVQDLKYHCLVKNDLCMMRTDGLVGLPSHSPASSPLFIGTGTNDGFFPLPRSKSSRSHNVKTHDNNCNNETGQRVGSSDKATHLAVIHCEWRT
ncbi:hypothetical protein E2C01_051783 [Portunus trituberculatus]|uniref:Uncharacterized protein n=1 Tax=Portunus trituberculatus TaxID=210409 RepID=A0A5B7GK96_PORTR|nr:hypothetical protein [Portunus trituberculatus]